ncbi:blastoderm-specific protein 25D [Fopius arisanus]|uniref:Blastoderm-specific protein 25D n=1 Tax=Fopius arisanus TaxID=64838 RepID=A0A9R1SYH5_9HYME|nr:PREDICTED: blastoderm-specific protein 25D [Fopius arisanus]XP_011299467.1 PREDICTED: blastoderm-specific protein 25D [Fopius arisanus]XP_011299468.1 PREDICTED: blastoderm-specific protein 25D [Fopius arisanus]
MEARPCDPYEQQLFSVFESCLEPGHSHLSPSALRSLCDKLQLEERGEDLISSLLSTHPIKNPKISFTDFKNGLVTFLGNTESPEFEGQTITSPLKESPPSSPRKHGHWSNSLESQRLRQFCYKFNGNMNGTPNPESPDPETPLLSKHLLESLFEKLDMDCDGLINFSDFTMLFQNSRNIQDTITTDFTRLHLDNSNHEKNLSCVLGPDQTGFLHKSSVINLWELAGVADAKNLLSDLGFSSSEVSLTELTSVLNDEIKSLQHDSIPPTTRTHVNLLKGALVIYQEEVRSLNTIGDQLRGERDKLRMDVAEANERASLLAQEIDESHIKLEKSRNEQIKQLELKHTELMREITHQNSTEREAQSLTIKSLNQQLQNLQQEEQNIRSELASVLKENLSLELENQRHLEQISKLKHSNNQLLLKVQILAAEHDEAVENDERENEQVISLVERIKTLQAESALLRDQNDELTSELEVLKNRNVEMKNRTLGFSKLDFSDSSEGPNSVCDSEPLADQAPELKEERQLDSVDSQVSNVTWLQTDEANRLIRDLKTILDDSSVQPEITLSRHNEKIPELFSNLESLLEGLLRTADSIKRDKNDSKENECEERTSESLRDLVINKTETSKLVKRISTSDGMINIDRNFNNLETKSGKHKSLRDYPPRTDESSHSSLEGKLDKENLAKAPVESAEGEDLVDGNNVEAIRQDRDRLTSLLKEQEMRHSNEKRILQDQLSELEKSLDSLRTEYYQCEDYWAGKLEEERQLIEQEQKISDDKLAELIAKIAEYEEQFSMGDKSRNDGRLSPIDEKFNLEQQYMDLQEELDEVKIKNEEVLAQKDREIIELEEKVAKREVERTDMAVQTVEHRSVRRSASLPSGYPHVPGDNSGIGASMKPYHNSQKSFEPGKLNQIAEHSISSNELLFGPSRINFGCYCQHAENYSGIGGEIRRLLQRKAEVESECNSLIKQKELLFKEIIEMQSLKGGQFCSADVIMKDLISKLQAQEQKIKSLQEAIKKQRICTEKLMEKVWKQHKSEVDSLQMIVKNTQESLHNQIQVNSGNVERLGKIDMVMKDLWVENAFLKKKVEKELGHCEHRHVVSNCSTESTSV